MNGESGEPVRGAFRRYRRSAQQVILALPIVNRADTPMTLAQWDPGGSRRTRGWAYLDEWNRCRDAGKASAFRRLDERFRQPHTQTSSRILPSVHHDQLDKASQRFDHLVAHA